MTLHHCLAPALLLAACTDATMSTTPTPVSGGIQDPSGSSTSDDVDADDTMTARFDLAPSDLPIPGDEDCAESVTGASLGFRPVDIILVIDTSGSMNPVSSSVEANLNGSLTQLLADSGLDYRVIAIANYGAGAALCLAAPLGQDACDPPGPLAPVGPTLFQYSIALGSGSFLEAILGTYDAPPSAVQAPLYAVQPMGWHPWLRPEAMKVFIGITDAEEMANAPAQGDAFDANLLALDPVQFGTPGARNYVFHTIAGMTANPDGALWLPDAPIVTTDCVGFDGKEPGEPMQQVSKLTGGLRFPLCNYASFDALFQVVATGVVEASPVSCDLPIPPAEDGGTLDPDTLQVEYTDGAGVVHLFHQVPSVAACEPEAFYVVGDTIHLCPAPCTTVQQDNLAMVKVHYGCDVGYDPNG